MQLARKLAIMQRPRMTTITQWRGNELRSLDASSATFSKAHQTVVDKIYHILLP